MICIYLMLYNIYFTQGVATTRTPAANLGISIVIDQGVVDTDTKTDHNLEQVVSFSIKAAGTPVRSGNNFRIIGFGLEGIGIVRMDSCMVVSQEEEQGGVSYQVREQEPICLRTLRVHLFRPLSP